MNPQDFDALLSTQSGFFSQNQMVNQAASNQLTQQALQNVQTLQTQVPLGNMPAAPTSPTFNRLADEQLAAQTQFYVLINNEQKGPISLEQLKGLAVVDVITPESMVWRIGTPDWTDLKTCLANLSV